MRARHGAARTTTPVFDKAAMLERLMGDEDLAKEIMALSLDDIPRQIRALKDFVEAGDVPGIEYQAHTIKGASANVGGEALCEVAFEMEEAGKAGDLSTAKGRMAELEAQFDRLKEAMEKDL